MYRFVREFPCCTDELFRSDYIRTNKAGGLKSLRCFPHCCRGHRTKTFCGTGVKVETDAKECTMVFSYFACNEYDHEKQQRITTSPFGQHDKEELTFEFQVGKQYRIVDFEAKIKTKDNLFGQVFPGHRQVTKDGKQEFVINGDRQCWHYGWFSSRVGNKYTHCLKVFFFRPLENSNEIECIGTIQSNDFHIRSSRVVRKKTRLERRFAASNAPSPADGDEVVNYDLGLFLKLRSSTRSSRAHPHPQNLSLKRPNPTLGNAVGFIILSLCLTYAIDILCLLNPNSPRVTDKVAKHQHVSPATTPIHGRVTLDLQHPVNQLESLVHRSNDIYFVVQVLSRVADFHTDGNVRKYFSLTPFHFFFVKSLTLELPLSCPRITCGSVMEKLLTILVDGVEKAIENGFLAKLRDYVMCHPTDIASAYSEFLGYFERELIAMGPQFPEPYTCTNMTMLAEGLATAFAAELGEKYKDLLPSRVYVAETASSSMVESLYLGKEFAAAIAASSASPQWSPTLKNNAFSSLTGKWTRLSLQCQMQPQRHPAWLYRLLTDVASRIWSIDDRGDEMLILWPGSVGTSHIIHKLCGKHRCLNQSPYGLRSECTQLVGYLGKRNFRDNTVTLEYYYWPADTNDTTSMRKRLTRHFRTHPDHPHLLEIHNVLEVCRMPEDANAISNAIDQLTYPGAWRLESSSMDTYERTPYVYLSMENEAMTSPMLDAILADKKRFYVPKVTGKHSQDMVMLEAYSSADLASFPKNKWGIPEPAFEDQDGKKRNDALNMLDLDLILVPGVAFDSKCNRLGHGKGYYDCFFQRYFELNHGKLPVTIGIALSAQMIENVPTSEHDKVLDMIATPEGIIYS
ncbi:5-formyltetrahydrofolate cyclo-ligase [Thraustotheca clavata]|uniref:5-formyltetrahydrofolate cyclo-ligase n=1 Tax=Thraustotheca clavata TaxID=74557 RepID=A0A1W0A6M5_9STRA|nr:5-formyltetrahydrofolate cyclo-ligase [Thraustotheca clavata]